MKTYYFDSSALVKQYIPENGSQWVAQVMQDRQPGGELTNLVATSQLGVVEIAAAVARLQREGKITPETKHKLFLSILGDSRAVFQTLAVADDPINLAALLTQRHPLRGYDAVHLASALLFNQQLVQAGFTPLTFVSADKRLCEASLTEGLSTENPESYP
jgi:predicted nucleic acid-binding protein